MRVDFLLLAGGVACLGLACAAIPDVTFAPPPDATVDVHGDTGSVEASTDDGNDDGEGDVESEGGDSGALDGSSDGCPLTLPSYAAACCGPNPCVGNDCSLMRCSAECEPTCTTPAQPVCCLRRGQSVQCFSVSQAQMGACP